MKQILDRKTYIIVATLKLTFYHLKTEQKKNFTTNNQKLKFLNLRKKEESNKYKSKIDQNLFDLLRAKKNKIEKNIDSFINIFFSLFKKST